MQRAILVLGAGRSGTSTAARALQASGVYLGERLKRPTRKNPRGFFEEVHVLRRIKAVRRELGLRPDSVRLIEPQEWRSPGIDRLRSRMADTIRDVFSDHPVWGFKYGSNGRLLPFWLELLPAMDIEPAFVFAYRNPLSVARSRLELDPARGRQAHSDLEWLVNVVPYFRHLRGRPLVVVDFDRMVDDPAGQTRRIAQRLNLHVGADTDRNIESFAQEFICTGLRHTRYGDADLENDTRIHPLVRRAASQLSRLARDESHVGEVDPWETWRAIEDELHALAPQLQELDRRPARGRYLVRALRHGWMSMPLLRSR